MTKAKQQKLVECIKNAIFAQFGEEEGGEYFIPGLSLTREQVEQEVNLASLDTGKNAPASIAVIYTEGWIPNPYRDMMEDKWHSLQAKVNEDFPDTHWEAINGGCVAWYAD